ncbi:MAG: Anti-sigma factor NepR [Rhodospirillales bacterium]|jgi:hypothetical protein|nr:Anti-sigma factor NepR [Rhodospirillales bacterium]
MDTLNQNQARQPEDDFPGLRTIESPADPAFDQWLTHHLRQLYDPVVQEPIPRDLIKLLEARLK